MNIDWILDHKSHRLVYYNEDLIEKQRFYINDDIVGFIVGRLEFLKTLKHADPASCRFDSTWLPYVQFQGNTTNVYDVILVLWQMASRMYRDS